MKKIKILIFPFIIVLYGLIYVATSVEKECLGDCETMMLFNEALRENRNYVHGASKCGRSAGSDTLCINVKDSIGINWNLLADTACMLATQKGLLRQKLFLIRTVNSIRDTILFKQCP